MRSAVGAVCFGTNFFDRDRFFLDVLFFFVDVLEDEVCDLRAAERALAGNAATLKMPAINNEIRTRVARFIFYWDAPGRQIDAQPLRASWQRPSPTANNTPACAPRQPVESCPHPIRQPQMAKRITPEAKHSLSAQSTRGEFPRIYLCLPEFICG